MSAGRQGGRRGRGGLACRCWTLARSSPAATTPAKPIFDTERKSGAYDGVTFVVTDRSRATFQVREQLGLIPLPHHAEMRTTALSGEIHLDSRPSVVEIDLHQLLEGWGESEVTWEERADDFEWRYEEADGTSSHKATAVGKFPATRNGAQNMDVT